MGVPFYVSLDDSSGRVIGGRGAKTAWVDMQPAFAAHEERRRQAWALVGWVGRVGRGCVCGLSEGWAGLGWAGLAACTAGGGNQREDGGTYLARMNGSVTGWGAKAVA